MTSNHLPVLSSKSPRWGIKFHRGRGWRPEPLTTARGLLTPQQRRVIRFAPLLYVITATKVGPWRGTRFVISLLAAWLIGTAAIRGLISDPDQRLIAELVFLWPLVPAAWLFLSSMIMLYMRASRLMKYPLAYVRLNGTILDYQAAVIAIATQNPWDLKSADEHRFLARFVDEVLDSLEVDDHDEMGNFIGESRTAHLRERMLHSRTLCPCEVTLDMWLTLSSMADMWDTAVALERYPWDVEISKIMDLDDDDDDDDDDEMF